jgi:hypothetical protein
MTPEPPLSPMIVEMLRGVLDAAKRGELTGVAIATASHEDVATVWALDTASTAEMIGATAILLNRLITGNDDP